MRAVAIALLLGPALIAGASASAASIAISGDVAHPRSITDADLAAAAQVTDDVAYGSEHGERKASFTGVLLWTLLDQAQIVDPPGPGKHHLERVIFVRGRDGYQVALAIGELDPQFEGKHVLLASSQDGVRLVVPGDAKGGRYVRDVVAIEVR